MACAYVQPATVKAHAPMLSRFPTSGFGRRSKRYIGAARASKPNVAPERRGDGHDFSNAIAACSAVPSRVRFLTMRLRNDP